VKRQRILLAAVLTTLLVTAGIALYGYGASPKVRVVGNLTAEDASEIQRAISRLRWARAGQALAAHQFGFFFRTCVRDLAVGRTREMGLLSETRTVNGAVCPAAYAMTGYGWCSRTAFKYNLAYTTNGWQIILTSYRYG
jgi:hypothetical protein